jgi:hypothetical protein
MSFGFGTRRSRRPAATLTLTAGEARTCMAAHVLDAEFRRRDGRLEYRIHPGAAWRPIEEAGDVRPLQLAAPFGAREENR